MTNEPSPRPWRVDEYDASLVRDANGRFVARADSADAALILMCQMLVPSSAWKVPAS